MAPFLLTVCIPTYRRPESLDRAIASVVHQIEENALQDDVQLLVVNDASPDPATEEVLQRWASGLSSDWFRCLNRSVNLGMSGNLLDMLRCQAEGTYQLLLTDDDQLEAGSLLLLLQALRSGPSGEAAVIWTPRPSYREDGSLHCVECRSFAGTRLLQPGAWTSGKQMRNGFILSGLILRRDRIDFCFWETHQDNAFFPVLIVGDLLGRYSGCYLDQSLVRHTVLNQCHWERWGRTQLEIEARLFRDFQDCFPIVRRRQPRLKWCFSLGAVLPQGRHLAHYAMMRGGLVDYRDRVGTRQALRLLRQRQMPLLGSTLVLMLVALRQLRDVGRPEIELSPDLPPVPQRLYRIFWAVWALWIGPIPGSEGPESA